MTIYNANYRNSLTLGPDICRFELCTFQQAIYEGHFVYSNDANLHCSFISCLFLQINSGIDYYVLYINDAAEGIQDRCCYSEETSTYIYGSEINLKTESVNSTICTNSNSYAPYCRCSIELTSFFNNNSFLYMYAVNCVSCYSHGEIPSKEDNNCFFSGSSCSGYYPVYHASNNANCVLTKFNFVNNTDSSGYFGLGFGNYKRVKESVIVFKSTGTLNWVCGYTTDATLSIESCTVIASGTIQEDAKVTLASGTITTTASQPTHTPFHSHPKNMQCWWSSINFSKSSQLIFSLWTLFKLGFVGIALIFGVIC